MFFRLVIEVVVAMLAAYGLYCALKALAEWLFPTEQLIVAIELRTAEDAEELDRLLYDARMLLRRRGGMRIAVLVSETLLDGTVGNKDTLLEPYEALLEEYGADCYLIDMD